MLRLDLPNMEATASLFAFSGYCAALAPSLHRHPWFGSISGTGGIIVDSNGKRWCQSAEWIGSVDPVLSVSCGARRLLASSLGFSLISLLSLD